MKVIDHKNLSFYWKGSNFCTFCIIIYISLDNFREINVNTYTFLIYWSHYLLDASTNFTHTYLQTKVDSILQSNPFLFFQNEFWFFFPTFSIFFFSKPKFRSRFSGFGYSAMRRFPYTYVSTSTTTQKLSISSKLDDDEIFHEMTRNVDKRGQSTNREENYFKNFGNVITSTIFIVKF